MSYIFITGAHGFVGRALCQELIKQNMPFKAGVRKASCSDEIGYGDLENFNDWSSLLNDVKVVIHLAARVHVMNDTSTDPLASFRKMNVEATMNLANAAKKAGVKRFIFLSSVKVNGESTIKPFSAEDRPNPSDSYGISKMEAEEMLLTLHRPGIFEIVIIRPPLVYGTGVKANFEKLAHLVQKKVPMPFGLVNNKRSLVSLLNLVDLIIVCIQHPKASGEIFLVSDDRDLSLKEIIIELAKTSGKKPYLIPIPVMIMKIGAFVLGKKSYAERLFGNLQIDIEKTKKLLGWKPKYSFEDTFKKN